MNESPPDVRYLIPCWKEPTMATGNRKRLRDNPIAEWELRVRKYRVLYNVNEDVVTVSVVAIAVKEGNRFMIDGEEYPL